jgi:hypothetical protein
MLHVVCMYACMHGTFTQRAHMCVRTHTQRRMQEASGDMLALMLGIPLAKLRTANFLSSSAVFFMRVRMFSTSASAVSIPFFSSATCSFRALILLSFSDSPPALAMSSNTSLLAGNEYSFCSTCTAASVRRARETRVAAGRGARAESTDGEHSSKHRHARDTHAHETQGTSARRASLAAEQRRPRREMQSNGTTAGGRAVHTRRPPPAPAATAGRQYTHHTQLDRPCAPPPCRGGVHGVEGG